ASSLDPIPALPLQSSTSVTSWRSATPDTYFGTVASSVIVPSSAIPYSTSHVIIRVTSAIRNAMSGVTLVSSSKDCVPTPVTQLPPQGTQTPTIAPDAPAAAMASSTAVCIWSTV